MRHALVTVVACAAAAAAGCSDGETTVDWDLRQSRSLDAVGWPQSSRDLTATEVRPEGPLRIRLPGGQTVTAADGVVRRISLERDGDRVITVALTSDFRTNPQAAELARRWARQFRLPTEKVDAWVRRDRGGTWPVAGADDTALTPQGPFPSVELRRSFNPQEKPTVVGLELFWPG